jgi:hypothetical protein
MFKIIINSKYKVRNYLQPKTASLLRSSSFYFSETTGSEIKPPEINPNIPKAKPTKEKISAKSIINHIKPYFFTPSSKKLIGYSLILTIISKGLISIVYNLIKIVSLFFKTQS